MGEFPKVLLITSTGLIGANLCAVLEKNNLPFVKTYHTAGESEEGFLVDITEPGSLRSVFSQTEPEVVILNAALTNVDYCQEHQEQARKINIEGTRNVVVCCRAANCKIVFFSTDYIFDGKNGPYTEEDKPAPLSFYGETKLEGEKIIKTSLKEFLIIRTTNVYGYEKREKNFCYRLIHTLKSGKSINVPFDQIASPTYAYNLSEVALDLVKNKKTGVYNVVGRDILDRYKFALAVCAEFQLDDKLVRPVKTLQLGQKAVRPLKAGLKIDKVLKETEVRILGVKESLAQFKQEFHG